MRISSALGALLLLAACGGGGGSSNPSPAPQPPTNSPPAFTSSASANAVENTLLAYTAAASDPNGDALTFSIAGGADAARFSITPQGVLSFTQAPNFEAPTDADGDNVYVVTLRVSDGQAAVTQTVQITVTNDREGIAVRRVGTGFDQPVYVAPIPGDSRVWVLEKTGNIMILDPATGAKSLFMSVRTRMDFGGGQIPDFTSEGERGLLGILAQSDYATSRRFYVYMTNGRGDVEVRNYQPNFNGFSYRNNLYIDQSQFIGNYGGWMGYGPDGHIYIAIGDGGGINDPRDNAQNLNSLLGKILRVAPNPDPFAGASPNFSFVGAPGNPFAAGGGDPRVFAYGLRNPYRASFHNGSLLIGDIGQSVLEEVNMLRVQQDAGANYGWPYREGTRTNRGLPPAGALAPVTEYQHGTGRREGRSVVGGYVYTGPIQSLAAHYVFADSVSGNIWTVPFQSLQQGTVLPASNYERRNEDFAPDAGSMNQISSFGRDAAGNLYIVDKGGDIFLVTPG